jgi:hypothetical protein
LQFQSVNNMAGPTPHRLLPSTLPWDYTPFQDSYAR